MDCFATRAGHQSSLVDCRSCKGGPWATASFVCPRADEMRVAREGLAEYAAETARRERATGFHWRGAGGSYGMTLERLSLRTPGGDYPTGIRVNNTDGLTKHAIEIALLKAGLEQEVPR